MCLADFIPSTTNFLSPNSGFFCHYVFVGHLYSKTLCEYICEESAEKEAESKDALIKGVGKKELGMVLCVAKK